MQIQRSVVPEASLTRGLWGVSVPVGIGTDMLEIGPEPLWQVHPADWYVVVDEIVEQAAGIVFTGWPELDEFGRPTFGESIGTAWFGLAELQRRVDELRAPQLKDQRRLRIGDVCAVRSDPSTIDGWASLRDFTADARNAARMSTFAAAAGTVDFEIAEELGLVPRGEVQIASRPASPSSGIARPTV